MSIYKDLIKAARNGKKFKIDLINKSLTIGKEIIIKDGILLKEDKELIEPNDLLPIVTPINNDPWDTIEFLYLNIYKYSVPRKESGNKCYFKAVNVDELTVYMLSKNTDRNEARAILEGYVLLASMIGWLTWEFGDNWFWQSDMDKELIVLRNFIE